jgi:hypothetical protein
MEPQNTNNDLKSQIMNRIEKESVTPTAKWIYTARESALWGLWILTILIGSLAIAVSIFVVVSRNYALYEATHETFLTSMIEFLPYLWFAIFGFMVVFAIYNLRHTKNGYRYPLWQIFASSLVLSVAGGGVLHVAGVGYMVDHQIGIFSPQYQSQEKMEARLWQNPEKGRLLGYFIEYDKDNQTLAIFEDINGVRFDTDISELSDLSEELTEAGTKVRLLGELISNEPAKFHACAVFPWFVPGNQTMEELREIKFELRNEIEKHLNHQRKQENRVGIEQEIFQAEAAGQSRCDNMPAMKRLQPAY